MSQGKDQKKSEPSKSHLALMAFAMALFERQSACYAPAAFHGGFDLIFPKRPDEASDLSARMCLQARMNKAGGRLGFAQSMSEAKAWLLHFQNEWDKAAPCPAFAVEGGDSVKAFGEALRDGVIEVAWAKKRIEESGWQGSGAAAQVEFFELERASESAKSEPRCGPRI